MVEIALISGIFSFFIFGLGVWGKLALLERFSGFLGLGIFSCIVYLAIKKKVWEGARVFLKHLKGDKTSVLIFVFLLTAGAVNLIGALGPELGFDSLWYHLTLPKIYLNFERIVYLPGNLFYYSAMPKLTEMLYLFSLYFSPDGILAKIIHFSFGALSVIVLFKLSLRFLNLRKSLLVCLVFYSSLIVGWESTTAYVDLARTFFEITALYLFFEWFDKSNRRFLIESAVVLGLAVSVKMIAFATLLIFFLLILLKSKKLSVAICYSAVVLFVVSPWLIFSCIKTGSPVYPVFSGILDQYHEFVLPNPLMMFRDFWTLLYRPQDLISPIFLILLPIVLWEVIKNNIKGKIRIVGIYVLLSALFWSLIPKTGGSRFILPYLPAISLFFVATYFKQKKFDEKLLIGLALLVAFFNITYRLLANLKYLPVLTMQQTKSEFLMKKLNFNFNDFFDENSEIKKIVKNDTVLIIGSHNLFYADFPFYHISFAPKNKRYAYLLTQNTKLPKDFGNPKEIYRNYKTNVALYVFGGEYK